MFSYVNSPFLQSETGMTDCLERRDKIISLLEENGKVKVEDLSDRFDVSSVTIRNDLDYLEDQQIAFRIYGGAIAYDKVGHEAHLTEKKRQNTDQKKRIGKAAAEFVEDGDSIILDSGTTTRQVAAHLRHKNDLTILTNAINIALELADVEQLSIMITGGTLREQSYALVGPDAERILNTYSFDRLFLGVDGVDLDAGLTTPTSSEGNLKRMMVEQANEVTVVTDSSKCDRRRLTKICPVDDIDRFVTDQDLPGEYRDHLESNGVDTVTA